MTRPVDHSSLANDAGEKPVWEQHSFDPLPVTIQDLGLKPFREVWELQRETQRALIAGEQSESVFLCEHPPVITLGKSASEDHLRASPAELSRANIEVIRIERGGDVTFHGPGQLVVYPIIDLRKRKTAVDWYMRSLEEVIIRALHDLGFESFRIVEKTGVWTGTGRCGRPPGSKKIGSIGVRLSRWCTMHGFSLNIEDLRESFALIDPCGMQEVEVSSVRELLEERRIDAEIRLRPASSRVLDMNNSGSAVSAAVLFDTVKERVLDHFCQVFNYWRV